MRSTSLISTPLILACCFGFLSLILGGATSADAADRLALLIGNSRYEYATPLRNPENDVDLLEMSLKKADFRTYTGKNKTRQALEAVVTDFLQAAKASDRPVLLIYFSGHGAQLAGKNYLLATDAKAAGPDEIASASLSANDLLERLRSVNPRLAILILDACRNDPFENATKSLTRGLMPIASDALGAQQIGKLIAFATSPGNTAEDGNTGNSPYASALAEEMLLPGLGLQDVFKETRKKVLERTNGTQEPWEESSLYEDFFFVPAAASAQPETGETTIWDFASMVNTAEAYQRYLDRYSNGLFAEIARRKIAAINTDFSYRRKAELFPIVQYGFFEFPECTKNPTVDAEKLYQRMFKELGAVEGQIVYVDFAIPLQTMFCGTDGTAVNYAHVTAYNSNSGNCEHFGVYKPWPGFSGSRVRCAPPDLTGDAPGATKGSGWPDGGIRVRFTHYDFLTFPIKESSYFKGSFQGVEYGWPSGYFLVQGLARVTSISSDGYTTVEFAPVDPKEVGLTWKFDNTAAEAKLKEQKRYASLPKRDDLYLVPEPKLEESVPEPGERVGGGSPEDEERFHRQALAPLPAQSQPRRTLWEHNGSILYLETSSDGRRFYYQQPRPGIASEGVTNGTLLFDGKAQGSTYVGTAFIFNSRCGKMPYQVSGPILDDGSRVVVRGNAPRFDGNCRVKRHVSDTLEFRLLPGQ